MHTCLFLEAQSFQTFISDLASAIYGNVTLGFSVFNG